MLPNFRKNPLTGHWVIVAEGREMRPNEFQSEERRSPLTRCPFCGGHEDDTPGEAVAYLPEGRQGEGDDWMVRVVPNKYPALETELPFHSPLGTRMSEVAFLAAHGKFPRSAASTQSETTEPSRQADGEPDPSVAPSRLPVRTWADHPRSQTDADHRPNLFDSAGNAAEIARSLNSSAALPADAAEPEPLRPGDDAGVFEFGPYHGFFSGGIHELVVESRRHVTSFSELHREEARLAVHVYQDRLRRVAERPELRFGMLFKNCRPGAGASIEHAHSQLIGTTVVPSAVRYQRQRAQKYRHREGRPLLVDMVHFEREAQLRIVTETERLVAFCPFASHMAFETWIFPKQATGSFLDVPAGELEELADLLQDCVGRAEHVLEAPPYNFAFHLAPFDSSADDDYQWHVEIAPRLTKLAGFEWGTGCMILPISPENAARRLREASGFTPTSQ